MNDRGIGLSTPDLLRNLILRRATDDTREETIDLWGEILGIESDANLNYFLRHYWLSHYGDVKTQSLYRAIKDKVLQEDIDSRTFTRNLRDSALLYREIIAAQNEDGEISKLLSDVSDLGANVLYPAILSAFEVGEDEVKDFLKALVVTFVRHNAIGGLETSQLETHVYTAAKDLRENKDFESAIIGLRDFAPDDERFKEAFGRVSITRRATARYILKELEQAARKTEELDVAPPNRVHVEHIYPQTPVAGMKWANHTSIINRLGNLTLLSRRLNTAIRNGVFADKKPAYAESELKITNGLCKLDDWNSARIEERQMELSESSPQLWAFP